MPLDAFREHNLKQSSRLEQNWFENKYWMVIYAYLEANLSSLLYLFRESLTLFFISLCSLFVLARPCLMAAFATSAATLDASFMTVVLSVRSGIMDSVEM